MAPDEKAALEEKLRAFYNFREKKKLENVPKIVQTYSGTQQDLFLQLDLTYPDVAGWGLVRDALVHYYSKSRPDATKSDVDKLIEQWYAKQPKGGVPDVVAGHFYGLWDLEGDYMKHRRHIIQIIHDASQSKEAYGSSLAGVDDFMDEYWGREHELVLVLATDINRSWASKFLERHDPSIIDHLDVLFSENNTVSLQETLKMRLLQTYVPDFYKEIATFCPQHPDTGSFLGALVEFLQYRGGVETAVELYQTHKQNTGQLVEMLFKQMDTESNFRSAYQKAELQLFPPWRMPSYPPEIRPPEVIVFKDADTERLAKNAKTRIPWVANTWAAGYPTDPDPTLTASNAYTPHDPANLMATYRGDQLEGSLPADLNSSLRSPLTPSPRRAPQRKQQRARLPSEKKLVPAGDVRADKVPSDVTLYGFNDRKALIERRWQHRTGALLKRVTRDDLPSVGDIGELLCGIPGRPRRVKEGWVLLKAEEDQAFRYRVIDGGFAGEDDPVARFDEGDKPLGIPPPRETADRFSRFFPPLALESEADTGADPTRQLLCQACSELCRSSNIWKSWKISLIDCPPQNGWIYTLDGAIGGDAYKGKWTLRYMRATYSGVHWYADEKEASRKKPLNSIPISSKTARLIDTWTKEEFPQRILGFEDKIPPGTVFAIQTNSPNYIFWLRTKSANRHNPDPDGWMTFFKNALSIDLQDDDYNTPTGTSFSSYSLETTDRWKERIPVLENLLEKAEATFVARADEAKQAQLSLSVALERLVRASSEQEWQMLTAAKSDEEVKTQVDRLKQACKEKERLVAELDYLQLERQKAQVELTRVKESATEAGTPFTQLCPSHDRPRQDVLAKAIAQCNIDRDTALAETKRITNLIEKPVQHRKPSHKK
ncbi:hypothetical protein DIPPA_30909 [Diplonema papillatum]|nr:hypothetical protein DIPPA_30909 [Diplonema papillatum]